MKYSSIFLQSSNAALQRNSVDGNDSESSQNSLDEAEINSDVCLYSLTDIRMSNEGILNRSVGNTYALVKNRPPHVLDQNRTMDAGYYKPPWKKKTQLESILQHL